MAAKPEFTILLEEKRVDLTDPAHPVNVVRVTYQAPTGRVSYVDIVEKEYTKEKRNALIKEAIKKLPPSPFERVPIE